MPNSLPTCDFGWKAPDFTLKATDGRSYGRDDLAGPRGLLVMFICNHCPYVLAVIDRIIRDARDLQTLGIGVAAICSNDPVRYPADGFEPMAEMARQHAFPFPYLHDADQSVARAFDAQCTPEFFGFAADLGLQYCGRLDGSGKTRRAPGLRRELYEAMVQVAETGTGPREQIPSMGCSIKWAAA